MDRELVDRKLESLARCVTRVESKVPQSADDLSEDYDLQDIIALNLERAIQLCVDIGTHHLSRSNSPLPETMAGVFPSLASQGVLSAKLADSMAQAVGLRNLAVHEYSSLDWKRLYAYLPTALNDLRKFAAAIQADTTGP